MQRPAPLPATTEPVPLTRPITIAAPEVDLGELGVGDIDLGKLGVADRRGREADENDEVGPTS